MSDNVLKLLGEFGSIRNLMLVAAFVSNGDSLPG